MVAERTVRARYLVAADGSHSPVRQRLGIPLLGHGTFSDSITIYFRADVRPLLGDRNLSVIYVFGPRLQGFFRFSKAADAGFLVVNTAIDADGNRSTDLWTDTSEERCIGFVREALGAPDLPIEIENVQRWNACAEWAAQLRRRARVPRRRRSARHAPDRRLRRQHGRPGRCTTSRGSSLSCSAAPPARSCSRPMRRSACRSQSSPSSRRTRGTCSGSRPSSARRTSSRSSRRRRSSSATGTARTPCSSRRTGTTRSSRTRTHHRPVRAPAPPHLVVNRDGAPISVLDLMGRGFVALTGRAGDEMVRRCSRGGITTRLHRRRLPRRERRRSRRR